MTIFMASMSGSKNFSSVVYRFLHFRRTPSLRLASEAAERNKKFGYSVPENLKQSSSRGKRKKTVFFCRRVRTKVRGKVIPTIFLKNEEKELNVGAEERRKRESKLNS